MATTVGDARELMYNLVASGRALIDQHPAPTSADFTTWATNAQSQLAAIVYPSYLAPWTRLTAAIVAGERVTPRERLKACVRWLEQKAGAFTQNEMKPGV